ncbi:UNVERIFIED_CONTAM: putative 2-oxoglutarate-dependent dioxygenase [Sesamum calycinum]|uniref:2-oxoglutarate-dependent dioxygenase n=1 Tax=Sesamum calycinum TaxID=2727403 RepID=A0AAW2RQ98_9LAMI
MNCPRDWPEPIVRVQSLSDSGIHMIPERYVKPPEARPALVSSLHDNDNDNIPLIDLGGLLDDTLRESTLRHVSDACREWDSFKWEVIAEYSAQVVRLGGVLLKILSINLGLQEDFLQNTFGGDNIGACLRVNFYPKCPQPDLTLGLSPHSDPGGLTFLLPDQQVPGLQVRRGNGWITVKPAPHAFIVNIGDQIQSDLLIGPAKELVTPDRPALYPAMTFDEYRLYIRTKGPKGKSQLGESLTSPK